STIRSLRPSRPAAATWPVAVRTPEWTIRTPSNGPPAVWPAVWARQNRPNISGNSRGPSAKPNDSIPERIGNARHVRYAEGRQRISKARWRVRADFWCHNFLRNRQPARNCSRRPNGAIRFLARGADLVQERLEWGSFAASS